MAKIIKLEEKTQGEDALQAAHKEKTAMTSWLDQMIVISTLLDDHFKKEQCPAKYS